MQALTESFLSFSIKLIEQFFSAVNFVPSNLYVRPSLRIKISFSSYQHVHNSSYLIEKLYNFYQIHYLLTTLLFYQIQYHIENIYTYQYHYI